MLPKLEDMREKIKAIEEVEGGSSIREVSRRLEVSHGQIIREFRSKETLREVFVKTENPVRKRNRLGKEPKVDEVLQWFGTHESEGSGTHRTAYHRKGQGYFGVFPLSPCKIHKSRNRQLEILSQL